MAERNGGHEVVVAQVLQIMVQHVQSLSKWDVAGMLQLSSACRRALQQAVGCLKIDLPRSVVTTTGFAAWLPQHAGLVQELALARPRHAPASTASAGDDAGWAAVEQLIVFALQISSTPPAVAAAAVVGPQPHSQPAPLLRLRSFTSSYVHSPAALRSLAPCSHLTELVLLFVPPERFTAAFCGAIGQLRSLRKFSCHALTVPGAFFVYPSSFAAAVGQLTQLEDLSVCDRLRPGGLSQLPVSLTKAYFDVEGTGSSPADINISHLSRLHTLQLNMVGRVSAVSQLPDSLTAMTLLGPADAIPGLGQLQLLDLREPAACLPLMQRLPELPRLQHVLVGLQYCRREQLEPVLEALSAGTQLTGLQLYLRNSDQELDGPRPGDVNLGDMRYIWPHSYLNKLPQLQMLHVSGLELDPADLMHFTSLTALTDLRFADCRGTLDLGIAAIMQRLTGLRKLQVVSLDLNSPLIWVAAACLTNLQCLKCMTCGGITLTDETLHLLSPLTNLTHLVLDHGYITYDQDGDEYFYGVSDESLLLRQLPLLD